MSEFTRRLSFFLIESEMLGSPLPASFFREEQGENRE